MNQWINYYNLLFVIHISLFIKIILKFYFDIGICFITYRLLIKIKEPLTQCSISDF